MKHLLLFLALLPLSLAAQTVSTVRDTLCHSERRTENYGLYYMQFTVYTADGQTYLRRGEGFSGALMDPQTKAEKARMATDVTMPLSKKQVKQIFATLQQTPWQTLVDAYMAEDAAYKAAQRQQEDIDKRARMIITERGDTLYREAPRVVARPGFFMPARWAQRISWDGMPQIRTAGECSPQQKDPDTWQNQGHPARQAYVSAIDKWHDYLDDIVQRYKMKHLDKDE